jgi:uncharacterized membrane protein
MSALPTANGLPGDLLQISFRWTHFLAGVIWIGHLYFFNWVNAQFNPKLDAETKKKVVPELMPRALFWFRWGAAVTWLTGVSLAMLLYYKHDSGLLLDLQTPRNVEPMDWLPAFGLMLVGFLVYDMMFKMLKTPMLRNVGTVIWGALAIGYGCLLETQWHFSHRAIFIHLGALFGTAMAANVWMRIWPAQKRIITAIKNGQKPVDGDVAVAGLRSRHNTYMSVPLLLFMVSVHQEGMLDRNVVWQYTAIGALVIGFVATHLLYKLSTKVSGF